MKYPLYNLNDTEFENLVIAICQEILGVGVISFAAGKDGGKDGKFEGKANSYPSQAESWDGKIIIQAKHTATPTSSCSDNEFVNIINKEIPKLKTLKQNNEIDYYLIFTNRKLTGLQEPKINQIITEKIGIKGINILGNEWIQTHLQQNPKVVRNLNLNKLLLPLYFPEQDLQELVIAFSKVKTDGLKEINNNIKRLPIEQKNKLNKLSEDYFNDVFKKSYSDFKKIQEFLENPINNEYKNKYENTISDIQEEITIRRANYNGFEEILSHLYKKILDENNNELMNKRNLIRIFLHYMYYTCDIGKMEESC